MRLTTKKIPMFIMVVIFAMSVVWVVPVTHPVDQGAGSTIEIQGDVVPYNTASPSPNYSINFTESGLPSSVIWSVTVNNETFGNFKPVIPLVYNSYISVSEPNGTYNLKVGTYTTIIATFFPSPDNGTISVDGKNVSVHITFTMGPTNAWEFNGAYANYILSQQTSSGIEYGRSYVSVTNINDSNGYYTLSYLKDIGSSRFSGVFTVYNAGGVLPTIQPSIFLIPSSTTLAELNLGNASMIMTFIAPTINIHSLIRPNNASLKAGVNISTPIGTLATDEISWSLVYKGTPVSGVEFHLYYDQHSGALIEYRISGTGNFTQIVQSTNIPMSGSGTTFFIKVSPENAAVSVNGIAVNTSSGNGSVYISRDANSIVLISASAYGYNPRLIEVNQTSGKIKYVNITLSRSSAITHTISGYVSPGNASVFVDGYFASVNTSGYYSISLPGGTYILSVTDGGYYSNVRDVTLNTNMSDLNFTLVREPASTSEKTVSNVTVTGYNVTVSNIVPENGNISVNYTATSNGTITVVLPYSQVKNTTISDLLSSRLYINGTQYSDFTVAISSSDGSYSVILTVHNLTGDPTLVWLYSPLASLPTKPSSQSPIPPYLEDIAVIALIVIIAGIAVAIVRRKKR